MKRSQFCYLFVDVLAVLVYYIRLKLLNVGDNGFGALTTAEEASEGINLSGKVMIVTGANTGIGLETARVLALRGAKVILHARNMEKAERAINKAREQTPNAHLDLIPLAMDLSSLDSISKFAEQFKSLNLPLHALILNAAVIPGKRILSEDGFEQQMAVTHIGHFYLTELLLDLLLINQPSRVVVISSEAHASSNGSFVYSQNLESPTYDAFGTYANSKYANVLFAKELDNLYHHKGLTAVSVHPGPSLTQLVDELIQSYVSAEWIVNLIKHTITLFGKSLPQVASTGVYCATTDLSGLGGRYFCDTHICSSVHEDIINEGTLGRLLWKNTQSLIQTTLKNKSK